MTSRWAWALRRILRQVWVRVVALGALAIGVAGAAQVLSPLVPAAWGRPLGTEAVEDVLGILASSMLAVTTFSLSIAVSAFAAAAGSATPRATALLQRDRTTQNVLATFLGSFLFGLVGMIGLQAGFYDAGGRLVLFVATVAVVAVVVVALLRWIGHLMSFGRMGDTLDRVEAAALEALYLRRDSPWLGGRPAEGAPPPGAVTVLAGAAGYVQHLDMKALAACAQEMGARLRVLALPGSFVHGAAPLLQVVGATPGAAQQERLRAAFTCARERSFDQDPRFGLIVLAEIASRALSPAVNDPGTAIGVIGRLVRILSEWRPRADAKVEHPAVEVPSLLAEDLLTDAFRPIARDGAALVEVQLRLHKALSTLAALAPGIFGPPARCLAAEALERTRDAPLTTPERAALEAALAAAWPPGDRPTPPPPP